MPSNRPKLIVDLDDTRPLLLYMKPKPLGAICVARYLCEEEGCDEKHLYAAFPISNS